MGNFITVFGCLKAKNAEEKKLIRKDTEEVDFMTSYKTVVAALIVVSI